MHWWIINIVTKQTYYFNSNRDKNLITVKYISADNI